jgi:hypothetical protein
VVNDDGTNNIGGDVSGARHDVSMGKSRLFGALEGDESCSV